MYISKDKFSIVWFFGVCYILPFIFTTHLIINDYSTIWLMCEIGGLFLLSLFINNFILLMINLIIGISFSTLYCYLFFPEKLIFYNEYYSYIPLFIFAIFCSFLFYYNTYSLVKLRNKIFIKNLQNKVVSDSQRPLIETSKMSLLMLKLLKDKKVEQQINKIIIPKTNYDETILFLEIMSSSLEKGKNITNIVLNNISNHNIDKNELDLRNFNSNDIVNNVINNYKFIYDNRLLINYNPDHDFNLNADYNLLVFVILNIMQNALKYKSQIDIGFSEEENFNVIYIKNKNSYIDSEKKKTLFKDDYSDTDETISLGLSFCKKSMIAFDGDIKVNSNKKGNWTKFSLYFPILE